MPDVFKELLSVYGGWAVFGALIVGGVIWFLANQSAKDGTEVSVLWGLVKYTKSGQSASKGPQIGPNAIGPSTTSDHRYNFDASRREFKSTVYSDDFDKGKRLELLSTNVNENKEDDPYILVNDEWLEGVRAALDRYTDVQREEKLTELVGNAPVHIQGIVDNVWPDYLSIERPGTNWVIQIQDDEQEKARSLHRGDEVTLLAEFSPRQIGVFKNGRRITRVIS